MAMAVHHVQVLTRDKGVLLSFLENTLEMKRQADIEMPCDKVAELLRRTVTTGTVRSTIVGSGSYGLVEVVECLEATDRPEEDPPATGALQLAFLVADLARCVDEARELGAVHVVGPKAITTSGRDVRIASLELAGVRIQLSEENRCG